MCVCGKGREGERERREPSSCVETNKSVGEKECEGEKIKRGRERVRKKEGDKEGEEKTRGSAGCKVSPGYDMWMWGCHQACEVEIIKN